MLGFVHQGGKGSHFVFKRKGEPVQLNFRAVAGSFHPIRPGSSPA